MLDAHQEGADISHTNSGNNFADIDFLGKTVTATFSNTTGFQWDNPEQYASFTAGEAGLLHPEHVFKPTIFAGGVSKAHTDGDFEDDLTASGAWSPANFTDVGFYVHNPSPGQPVYLGSGPNQYVADWGSTKKACHWPTSADYVNVLSEHARMSGCCSTCTPKLFTFLYMIPGKIMLEDANHYKVTAGFDAFVPLVKNGSAAFDHLSKVARRWRLDFDAKPNIFRYSEIQPDSYVTCPDTADDSESLPPLKDGKKPLPPLNDGNDQLIVPPVLSSFSPITAASCFSFCLYFLFVITMLI